MDMLWIGIHGHKTKKERDGERESASTDNLFVSREEYLSDTPLVAMLTGQSLKIIAVCLKIPPIHSLFFIKKRSCLPTQSQA